MSSDEAEAATSPLGMVRMAWRPVRRVLIALAIGVIGFVVLYLLGLEGLYDLNYAVSTWHALFKGALGTLGLIAVVIPLGFMMGFLFGWGRTSHRWLVRAVSTVYVEFFRSMPPIVLIAFAFLIVITIVTGNGFLYARIQDPFTFAISLSVVALGFHSGGYQAEVIRAGIQSVPAGQREAAEAIGLSRTQTIFSVVLPQMFRVSLPALGNQFASDIKDTSLLSAVGILELTFIATNIVSTAVYSGMIENILLVWVEVAIIYFVLTFIVSRGLQALEKRFRVPGLEAAQL